MHRAKNCPHKKSQQVNYIDDEDRRDSDDSEEVNITEEVSEHDIFIAEAATSAVVDTACTKTVAGESWFINYCKKLDNDLLNEIEIYPSETSFKFEDGRKVFPFQKVVIPVQIANHSCKTSCEIVKDNIPLLLSKQSLKQVGATINMQNDKAIIFDTEANLHLSTSGHYCVEIYPNASIYTNKNKDTVREIFFLEETLSKKQKEKQILKIHTQLGHSSSSSSVKKIKHNAAALNSKLSKIIDNVMSKCDICIKYRKPLPHPVVGYVKATTFNETISVDLHEIQSNIWYMHIIDEFTRLSNAVIIRSKTVAVKTFLKHWVSLFGVPRKIVSDNGGDFIGDKFYDMCKTFNIKIDPVPSGLVQHLLKQICCDRKLVNYYG